MNLLEVGMRIKKQRLLLNYTREELAEMVNITPRFCYDIELGNKKMSVDTLAGMRDSLALSTDYILYGETKSDNFDEILSLLKTCPPDKLEQLEAIISNYISAVK